MKVPTLLLLFGAILLAGCGGSSSQTTITNSASASPQNAASDYVGALAGGQTKAMKTVDSAALNEDVQMFYAQESRFPKDLNELVQAKVIDRIPDPPRGMKFIYDPNTGRVSVVSAQ